MSSRYVEVPAEALFTFLQSKGFQEADSKRSRWEVVYERIHHRNAHYKVLVYTSISRGQATARKRGADAIRVVAIYEHPNGLARGIAKTKRVFRTGTVEGVFERILERARQAYSVCNEAFLKR